MKTSSIQMATNMNKSMINAGVNKSEMFDKIVSKDNKKYYRSMNRTFVSWKKSRYNQFRLKQKG